MAQTIANPWVASTHAVIGVYSGADTVLSFGDPTKELSALRSGCGVFVLAWRAKITARGKDRVRWLHNMVTNNIRDLAPDRGNYNFVLNVQGRILGDLYIYNRGESLLLDTDSIQVEPILTAMKRYIIMDKVELTNSSEATMALGICGPKAEKILGAAGINAGGLEPLEIRNQTVDGISIALVRGPEQKPGWYEIWLEPANAQAVWKMLVSAGTQPVGAEAVETWRILHGVPRYGQDIRDRDLPQETEQTQALSFTKGCYIGQEIVERIRSRGQVHRKFTGFEFADGLPALGKFESEGRALAEITTAQRVSTAAGEKKLGLGYIRRESAAGSEVDLGGIKAKLVDLPFERSSV
jgi:folate-binding protein YgfZ